MSRASHNVPAVIVGAGLNGLGVLRSLAAAGVPSVVVGTHGDEPAMRSRHGRKVFYDAAGGGEALLATLERVAAGAADRPVLILTMEESVVHVMAYYARLATRFRMTLSAPDTLAPLLNKDGVRAAAEAAGLAIPRTLRIQSAADVSGLDALTPPLIVKPARRDAGYEAAFSKAYRFDTHAPARELVERILPVLPDVIVQEWIEGTDSDLYFCLQHLPADGAAPTSFVGRKIRSWPPRVGGTASCGPAPEAVEIIESTTAFFRQAGVHGLASMEYKRDPRSGRYVVVEPTVGRTDFQEEVATLNGVNLPLAAYRSACGLASPPGGGSAAGRIWRERMSDTQSAERTPAEETRTIEGARSVDALWRIDDPGPELARLASRVRVRLKRLLRSDR
ncbi:FAD-dependent oxidoreductase [Salinisphaera orenii]|uniref:FAD-dependent oxidoreductase n=1 Tax=Salinisphaera orenii YIM 95161 TaxID=1051139 RepID=A0A423Q334_9GAMM|nr:FAD-dependent oxidoreductase [Salinisphaera halophila]ROO33066.1 FAD-dependent oxidoreductase [Salinisphaera halophila YIM 95161]